MRPYAWLIPVLPLLSFFLIVFFGKRLPRKGHEIGILAIAASLVISLGVFFQQIAHSGEVYERSVTWFRFGDGTFNQIEVLKDATAHAEMLAITQAESVLGDWRLNECELYVTKEPCPMCAGAMVLARVPVVELRRVEDVPGVGVFRLVHGYVGALEQG